MLLGTYQPVPEYCPGLAACRHGLLQYRISIANGTEDCVHGFPCVWVGGCVCVSLSQLSFNVVRVTTVWTCGLTQYYVQLSVWVCV